ncbi:hypothetical protein [Halostella salina]|uniref:hypothetical protein n=1 Tax=Halostella salina TaxID=1547897 RepID=UPI000EF80471|nr:hypothetical protein [Halostella salina]
MTRKDFPDWMFRFAETRTAKRVAVEAARENIGRRLNDEEADFGTAWEAARAAAISEIAEQRDRREESR